jgi:hypothetical protein
MYSEVSMAQNNDSIITWSSFWSYFISPSCDAEMRLDMAKDLRLPEFLENISANGQIEVLEDAPMSIIRAPSVWNALKPKTIQELGLQQKETITVTAMPTYEEIRDEVYGKYKSK